MSIKIEQNMLRDRAEGITRVTDEEIKRFNPESATMIKEFLTVGCSGLSPRTIKQYTSGVNIYFRWVLDNHDNKPLNKHTKRMWQQYMAWLMSEGLSSNALKFKKASVSSMCEYVCDIVSEDEEKYETFKNFTKGKPIPSNKVYEKVPVKIEELNAMLEHFEEKEDYLTMSFLLISFYSGCRRSELVQVKVSDVMQDTEGRSVVITDNIIAKGRGGGKPIKLKIPVFALKTIKSHLETRGFESKYVFANPSTGDKVNPDWCNNLCTTKITPLLGRRVNPHILRASSATFLLESGKDIKAASAHLNHNGIEVTSLYDLRSVDDEIDDWYDAINGDNLEDGEDDE